MMSHGVDMESVAEQVGSQGVDKLVTDAERICTHEQRRIALANEPAIVRLRGEGAILLAEERRITDRLALAPPPGDLSCLRWKSVYYWALVILLAVTGLFSTLLSFAPFRLGWMSWLVSAGIALLTPFLVDQVLEIPGTERVLRVLTAVAAAASLACLMLLATVRGDLLAQQIRESETQTVIIDDTQPQAETPNTFYDRATELLCAALLLMAFATETGGGLVLHAAWRSMPDNTEDWAGLRHELVGIRGQLAAIASEITALRNAPQVFEARYWRDFYRALLLGATRSAMTKLLLVFLAALTLDAPRARAQDHLNLVVAIDLTRSVATVGPDGKSDFQKNVEGVSRVLAQVPAGTRLTVIGITGHSFTEPYILMRAQVPDDPGYFGERLSGARGQIVRAWSQKAARLSPDFKLTDIFGALELASQLFAEDQSADLKELVIFSDMRESVPGLDFERMKLVPAYRPIQVRFGEATSLRNVHVYVAGVDGAGKSIAYWKTLNRFWGEFLKNAGATLEYFAVLAELPEGR
jgi:hypothetical protein